jgi:hypothetical protein
MDINQWYLDKIEELFNQYKLTTKDETGRYISTNDFLHLLTIYMNNATGDDQDSMWEYIIGCR